MGTRCRFGVQPLDDGFRWVVWIASGVVGGGVASSDAEAVRLGDSLASAVHSGRKPAAPACPADASLLSLAFAIDSALPSRLLRVRPPPSSPGRR